VSEDLVLLPEVQARRALGAARIRLQVLMPYGSWIGCGTLRVLRLKMNDDRSAELIAGYDAYRPAARR
jgi:hypothetical protein